MATAKKAPAKKAVAKKATTKAAAPAKKVTAKTAAATKALAKKSTTHSATGLKQDRARVAAGQPHEVGYVAAKTGKSRAAVKTATKSAGPSRKAVMKKLGAAA